MFSICEALPQILELWDENLVMNVASKKIDRSEREITTPQLLFVDMNISRYEGHRYAFEIHQYT